jgi:membrane fusion protein (multidrug efflux system)
MRYVLLVLGLLVVIGGLATGKYSQISKLINAGKVMQAAGPPPETVATTHVEQQFWNDSLEAVATVVAAKGVTISTDVPGVVSRLYFESGATIKRGQILLELDAQLERAQLASIRAKRQLAKNVLWRSKALVETGTIAKAQFDIDDASFKSLVADEQALEAQIARKVIRAPFSGRLGLRTVNLGQYLAPGTAIAALDSTDSIYADFTLPQSRLPQISLDMNVRAYLEGDAIPVADGTVRAIEPSFDSTTRNVKVRASLRQANRQLSPGMFLRVALDQPSERPVTTIPATAVIHASYGNSVFRVETQKNQGTSSPSRILARQQFVKLGEHRGDYVAVLDGLAPGQEVVTAGAFKLRNGIPLAINNDVRLEPSLNPNPMNR